MKSSMRRSIAATVCALMVVPTLVQADNGPGRGRERQDQRGGKHVDRDGSRGHDRRDVRPDRGDRRETRAPQQVHKRQGAYFNQRQREEARRHFHDYYRRDPSCPPGLARKNNGCRPPGQVREWRVGAPLPPHVAVYTVPAPVRVYLPPPPRGHHYARVGGDIALVLDSGNIVIDIMFDVFD